MAVLTVGRISFNLFNQILNSTILHHFSEIHLSIAIMVSNNEENYVVSHHKKASWQACVVKRSQWDNSGNIGFQPSLLEGCFPPLGPHIFTLIVPPDLGIHLSHLDSTIARKMLLNFSLHICDRILFQKILY